LDLIEVDHIHPLSLGGKDEYKNLQLLHLIEA
jgi:RNA-directed DNA polymerase